MSDKNRVVVGTIKVDRKTGNVIEPGEPSEVAPAVGSDEVELRRMLAWAYSGHHLYCDDGELQDSREQPFIDFKRDTIAELKDKMEQRGLNDLNRELHQNTELSDEAR